MSCPLGVTEKRVNFLPSIFTVVVVTSGDTVAPPEDLRDSFALVRQGEAKPLNPLYSLAAGLRAVRCRNPVRPETPGLGQIW